jgi:PAS domain S-box-containing protein
MPRGLYLRVVISLTLGLAATVAPFGWWIGRSEGRRHVATVTGSARLQVQAQAEGAAHLLLIREYAGLEEQLLDAARIPGVVAVHLYEPDGTLLANVHRSSDQEPPRVHYDRERGVVPIGTDSEIEERDGLLHTRAPIVAGRILGWIEITHSLRAAEAMQRSIWRQTAILGAAWIAVGVMIVTLVLRRPMGAIRELAVFARDLDRRKGERLATRSPAEEIDLLAGALDQASVELANSERRLVEDREWLAITLQSLGEGVLACDGSGRVTLMNGVAETLTGWTAGDAVGLPFEAVFRIVDEATGEPIPAPLADAIETGHAVDPARRAALLTRDGTRLGFSDSVAPIVDAAGKAIGAVVVFRDESERRDAERRERELELQLRHAQKMEAIGRIAGGIAHDFNNVLTAIIGDANYLVAGTPAGGAQREAAQQILQASQRAAALTRGLLVFGRKQKMVLAPVDVNEVVRGVERMLGRVIGEDVKLQTRLSTSPLVVSADAAQLEQVLMNLATNARDAMPEGGLLSITTQQVAVDGDADADGRLPRSTPAALVTLSDTGVGIDDETAQRIFEPFFTTKEAGRGTGLGLSIVHGIIQQHGGAIRVHSRPGIGTTFRIFLPLSTDAPIAAAPEESGAAPGGTERILVVEDEAAVRRVIRRMLEEAGYRVTEASHGPEALELLRGDGAGIALVVCDVVMPRMNARELLAAALELRPGLPFLFVSGYAQELIAHRGLLDAEVELLMKPFSAHALLTRVRRILDR